MEKKKTFFESLSEKDKEKYWAIQRYDLVVMSLHGVLFVAILLGMIIPSCVYVSGWGGKVMFVWGALSWLFGVGGASAATWAFLDSYCNNVRHYRDELDLKERIFLNMENHENDSE